MTPASVKHAYLIAGRNQSVVRKEDIAGVTVGPAHIEGSDGSGRMVTEMEIVFKNAHVTHVHFNHPPLAEEQTAINAFIAAIYAD